MQIPNEVSRDILPRFRPVNGSQWLMSPTAAARSQLQLLSKPMHCDIAYVRLAGTFADVAAVSLFAPILQRGIGGFEKLQLGNSRCLDTD